MGADTAMGSGGGGTSGGMMPSSSGVRFSAVSACICSWCSTAFRTLSSACGIRGMLAVEFGGSVARTTCTWRAVEVRCDQRRLAAFAYTLVILSRPLDRMHRSAGDRHRDDEGWFMSPRWKRRLLIKEAENRPVYMRCEWGWEVRTVIIASLIVSTALV